jgi:hypothetical protein
VNIGLGQLAMDISFGEFLWSLLIIFFMIAFFVILFHVLIDVFRSHDLSGVAKAVWLIFIIILPFIGLLVYLIVRGDGMRHRDIAAVQESQQQFDTYVKSVAGGPANEIAQAKSLLDSGAISQEEFDAIKAKALG